MLGQAIALAGAFVAGFGCMLTPPAIVGHFLRPALATSFTVAVIVGLGYGAWYAGVQWTGVLIAQALGSSWSTKTNLPEP